MLGIETVTKTWDKTKCALKGHVFDLIDQRYMPITKFGLIQKGMYELRNREVCKLCRKEKFTPIGEK